ncbi:MAG: zinc-binding alcohol dehydrogenase [Catalinimonas sp.]
MKIKELRVTAPNQVELRETEADLRIERDDELIVRTHYSHVSAGTELACLAGVEEWFQIPGTPGYTAVGEVVAVGDAVPDVRPGDRVFTYGPHRSHVKITWGDRWHGVCVPVPDGLDGDRAAFAHVANIALTAIRRSDIELGDAVAVSGLGTIGNLAAQLAQLQGARVLGADVNDTRLDVARRSGIDRVVNPTTTDWNRAVADFTGGRGVTTFIDATGRSAVVEQNLPNVATNGEVILLGSPRAPHTADLTTTLRAVHLLSNVTLRGALEFSLPTFPDDLHKHSIQRNVAVAMELIRMGKLRLDALYTHRLSPAACQRAYDGLRDEPDAYVGVVFDWLS